MVLMVLFFIYTIILLPFGSYPYIIFVLNCYLFAGVLFLHGGLLDDSCSPYFIRLAYIFIVCAYQFERNVC